MRQETKSDITTNNDRLTALLAQFRDHPVVEQLGEFLRDAPDEELFHIDMGGLCERWGIGPSAAIELFLRSVRFGLLSMEWAFHCPTCGGVAKESLQLSHTHEEEFCPVCRVDFRSTLDENVEVFFSVGEEIRHLPEKLKEAYGRRIVEDITTSGRHEWRTDSTIHGVEIINHPVFREIFGDDTLPLDQSLEIKSATILFTDITGSTAMYERLGDPRAYRLVRDHFDVVFRAISNQRGLPIKTIGDAVMGVFTTEAAAVEAAFQMSAALAESNVSRGDGIDIVLKIGLHRGPVIVVTLNNRIDYFGHTVNIAARVQSVAKPQEVCLTSDVFEAPGVKSTIRSRVSRVRRGPVALKGVEKPVNVYRIDTIGASGER